MNSNQQEKEMKFRMTLISIGHWGVKNLKFYDGENVVPSLFFLYTISNLPIDQSMSYAANVRNLECDMDSGMCVYHPGIRDNWNVIHFLHTVRKINGDKLKEQFLNQYFTSHFSPILTRCPSVLS